MKDERPWDSTDLFLEECAEVKKLVDKLNDCMTLICEDVGHSYNFIIYGLIEILGVEKNRIYLDMMVD